MFGVAPASICLPYHPSTHLSIYLSLRFACEHAISDFPPVFYSFPTLPDLLHPLLFSCPGTPDRGDRARHLYQATSPDWRMRPFARHLLERQIVPSLLRLFFLRLLLFIHICLYTFGLWSFSGLVFGCPLRRDGYTPRLNGIFGSAVKT